MTIAKRQKVWRNANRASRRVRHRTRKMWRSERRFGQRIPSVCDKVTRLSQRAMNTRIGNDACLTTDAQPTRLGTHSMRCEHRPTAPMTRL